MDCKDTVFLRAAPRGCGDLRRDLGRVSTKVLTHRLRLMEKDVMINREVIPGKPPQVEYPLTTLGREFEPIHGQPEAGRAPPAKTSRKLRPTKTSQTTKKLSATSPNHFRLPMSHSYSCFNRCKVATTPAKRGFDVFGQVAMVRQKASIALRNSTF